MPNDPPRWHDTWRTDRYPDNPINRRPPRRFPYLSELMRERVVLDALDAAWRDTNADVDPIVAAVEQGGWIYFDLRTGRISIRRKDNRLGPARRQGENQAGYSEIDLNNPPVVAGSVVVANFHTHPMRPFGGASDPDIAIASRYNVPGIVRGQNGAYSMIGPLRRNGPFTNPVPGYPFG